MSKTTMITTRITPQVKSEASHVLQSLGLSLSEAINLFLHQIVLHDGLPFAVKIPNKTTQQAMDNVLTGQNIKSYKSLDDIKAKFK